MGKQITIYNLQFLITYICVIPETRRTNLIVCVKIKLNKIITTNWFYVFCKYRDHNKKKSLPTYFLIVLKKNTKVIYNYSIGCPIRSPSIQSRPAGFLLPAWTCTSKRKLVISKSWTQAMWSNSPLSCNSTHLLLISQWIRFLRKSKRPQNAEEQNHS